MLDLAATQKCAFPCNSGKTVRGGGRGMGYSKRSMRVGLSTCVAVLLTLPIVPPVRGDATDDNEVAVHAIGPLFCDTEAERRQFLRQAEQARDMKISGIDIDVWAGHVTKPGPDPTTWNWGYYDWAIPELIKRRLNVGAIMSTHACGLQVGDTKHIELIPWIHSVAGVEHEDLLYKNGHAAPDAFSAWSDAIVLPHVRSYIHEFASRYKDYAGQITHLTLSVGPASEVRTAAFHGHDFPLPGELCTKSRLAEESFRDWVEAKYGSLQHVQAAWGITLSSWDAVRTPCDARNFIARDQDLRTTYGRDLMSWYHGSLMDHLRNVLDAGHVATEGTAFERHPLAVKVGNAHWGQYDTDRRMAEILAGITPNVDQDKPGTYGGYKSLAERVQSFQKDTGRRVIVYGTGLDIPDNHGPSEWHSHGERTTAYLLGALRAHGIEAGGENALQNNVYAGEHWARMGRHLKRHGVRHLSVLRLSDVVGDARGHWQHFREQNSHGLKFVQPRR